jgi:amidase
MFGGPTFNYGKPSVMHVRKILVSLAPGLLSLGLPAIASAAAGAAIPSTMDRDLMEVTVPQLQRYYAEHRYTVTQVVQWHLARIHRYNGTYRAVETVMERTALETAAREDAEAGRANRGPLWGVPIVIKANTSIQGTPSRVMNSSRRATRRSSKRCAARGPS